MELQFTPYKEKSSTIGKALKMAVLLTSDAK